MSETEVSKSLAAKHMTGKARHHDGEALYACITSHQCEQHQVILANGAGLKASRRRRIFIRRLYDAQRNEIYALFPDCTLFEGVQKFQSARTVAKRFEATSSCKKRAGHSDGGDLSVRRQERRA